MESIRSRIETSVISYLEENGITRGSRIIAAWSGGPDSTVLAAVLQGLDGYGFDLTAAWYNHRLRPGDEMEREEAVIGALAKRLKLKLVKGSAASGAINAEAKKHGISIEDAARKSRYAFLEGVVSDLSADYLALGHNLNDNTETMLMRFLQNSGTTGLSGIPERRGRIIRPLCRVDRVLIEQFVEEEKLTVSIDKTNLGTEYLRNRIRHRVLPAVRGVFPDVDNNLKNLADKFRLQNDFIDQETEKRLSWIKERQGWRISADTFFSEHLLLRIRGVFSVLNRMGLKDRVRFAAVESAVRGKDTGNGRILLKTADFEIITSGGYIFIQRLVNHNKKSYFIYLKPGSKDTFSGQTVSAHEASDYEESASGAGGSSIVLTVQGPVAVRSYRVGDSINIEGGSKSLKKLFSEWKVKADDRCRLPVVEDCGSIIAVIGEHIGYKNRLACGDSDGTGRDKKQILLVFNSDTETTCE